MSDLTPLSFTVFKQNVIIEPPVATSLPGFDYKDVK